MNWRQLWNAGKRMAVYGLQQVETQVKQWTKPRSVQELICPKKFALELRI